MSTRPTWRFDAGSDATEWIAPTDMLLNVLLARRMADATGRPIRVAEIGVWKASWMVSMIENAPVERYLGVDPYPALDDVRARVVALMTEPAVGGRAELVADLSRACTVRCNRDGHDAFDVIHVDGEHTQPAVARDLAWAAEHLAPGGLLLVDDFRHPFFPGVSAALYAFLQATPHCAFLMTGNKAYLCHDIDAAAWRARGAETLDGAGLMWCRHYGEGGADPQPYIQDPSIDGDPVLLCVEGANDALAIDLACL